MISWILLILSAISSKHITFCMLGAIPIAVTNVSELCMWYESSNLIHGRTDNAYHQGRMVGGSSGRISCNAYRS